MKYSFLLIRHFLCLMLMLCISYAQAATFTFTNAVDNQWTTAGNWSPSYPGLAPISDVIIINGNAILPNQVSNFNQITINAGATLTNTGSMNVVSLTNNGTFVSANTLLIYGATVNNGIMALTTNFLRPTVNTITGTGTIQVGDVGAIGFISIIDKAFAGQAFQLTIASNASYDYIRTENSNTVNLTGSAINVSLDPSYVPSAGDCFNLLRRHPNGAFSGTIPTLTLPVLPAPYTWTVFNTPTDGVTIKVTHPSSSPTRAYVNRSATGADNGANWANAYTSLQSALNSPCAYDEIWVARGTYRPTTSTNNRNIFFNIPSGIKVYGGFVGNETLLSQRPNNAIAAGGSILSGNIGSNASATDNSYHVVSMTGTNNQTILDGFTITGGYADNASPLSLGGGIYSSNSAAKINNCVIRDNYCIQAGGGLYGVFCNQQITNTVFSNNTTGEFGAGGGAYIDNTSTASFQNCIFAGNNSGYGGAVASLWTVSLPVYTNCTFANNQATFSGAAIQDNAGGSSTSKNCIFGGNIAGDGVTIVSSSTTAITNSIVQGGFAGAGNLNANPLFVNIANPIGGDNLWGTPDDGLQIIFNSPAFNMGLAAGAPATDLLNVARPQGAATDMGAYEFAVFASVPLNCPGSLNYSLGSTCVASIDPSSIVPGATPVGYILTILNGQTVIPQPLTSTSIGKTYNYSVTHGISGNSCWGTITIEDKSAPVCPASLLPVFAGTVADPNLITGGGNGTTAALAAEVSCATSLDAGKFIAIPAFTDCSTFTATYSDVISGSLCTGNFIVERTWTAIDANGMTTTCTVFYKKVRAVVTAASISYPISATFPACSPSAVVGSAAHAPNLVGGFPQYQGGSLSAGSTASTSCQLSATWTDKVAATACGVTIARTWVIIDWCSGAVVTPTASAVQTISLTDNVAPTLTGTAPAAITISTSTSNCLSDQLLAPPAATDNCNGALTSSVTLGGFTFPVTAGKAQIKGLAIGTYPAVWNIKDACGNNLAVPQSITVKDLINPVVVADLNTKVALTQDCKATVNAITFDDGSLDNCCLDINSFEVARVTVTPATATTPAIFTAGTYAKTITFDKNDCSPATPMVALKVSDCNGNSNIAMVNVLVEDKIGPVAFGTSITVCCGSAPLATAWLNAYSLPRKSLIDYPSPSNPGLYDNCSVKVDSAITSNTIDNCSNGSMIRTYTVTDTKNNLTATATVQYITENRSAYMVEFPEDLEIQCVTGTAGNNYATTPASAGAPIITAAANTCPLVGVEHTDEVFNVLPGSGENGCFKIIRTWKILNWCQPLNLNADTGGSKTTDPTNTRGGKRKFYNIHESRPGTAYSSATNNDGNVFASTAPCAAEMTAVATAYNTNLVGVYDEDGYMEYIQIIKVTDNIAPSITKGNVVLAAIAKDCAVKLDISAPTASDCTGITATTYQVVNAANVVVYSGTSFPASHNFGTGMAQPFGQYTVRWIATDRCGNYSSTDEIVDIKDVKKPTPICYHGLSIDLMPTTGMVMVNCSIFDAGSYDNCTLDGCYLQVPAPGANAALPTFDHTAGGMTDKSTPSKAAKNAVFNCKGSQSVALWVRDAAGNYDYCETYIEVQNNMSAPNVLTCTTPIAGNKIAAAVKTEIGNEATANVTFDATGFLNPIKMKTLNGLAGNAYVKDGSTVKVSAENDKNPLNGVSTLDLVLISKHILGTQTIASNYAQIAADVNKSGKISTADLVELRKMILGIQNNFSNNTSWRFFATNMEEIATVANVIKDENVNFTAVKIGDINGNADAKLATGRSTLNFDVIDATLSAGQEVTLVMNNKETEGFQFALNYDANALEVVTIDENSVIVENGVIRTAQVGTDFTVTFKAKSNIQLSKAISIGSAIYNEAVVNGTSATAAINFNNASSSFELAQNQPNPFRTATVVSFYTPVESTYTMTITDMAGRTVQTLNGEAVKGLNNVNVEMTAAGVFNYTVKTANFTATKKMVVIE